MRVKQAIPFCFGQWEMSFILPDRLTPSCSTAEELELQPSAIFKLLQTQKPNVITASHVFPNGQVLSAVE